MSPSSLALSNLRAIVILIVLGFHSTLAYFFLIAVSLHFATGHSRRLDSLSANAYGHYLVHYNFVVWLQYALLGTALFVVVKAAIVFGGTLVLSWIAVLAVQRIPLGAQLIGAPRRAVAIS
jgi:surface polysaccharide O-acyltransferase-like enzyme